MPTNRAITKARLHRLIYLLDTIETVTNNPRRRGSLIVTAKDARLIRPIVEALVAPKGKS